ncbi:3'5'-cyclic nucleotide phosphodiesterase family protein [Trichomonas vaginalis G3]|uniref:Phosphodiesterase n=1 Tax=Trichomonas vaginalis (strain ATCC PRA-98 / G3) TaxID=412133 RepID=A2EY05_TRIV3|nr:cyclic nucleotide phosphodiesterase family [Trichomonas vaginalis G3]EAY02473.1 3'5'-cyclic nucleotide phosphodiesterase family protein [Trichomonas vaginalis G3]KAI5511210.1 cyclic nucleotide phosphodiesterase family [Trichomonas vaginalis G3]|eukprot:XP_001314712.1 3'5'-cyclic nucleotide phosphodiesterase family protein [Trichomonas vaginalis G3]
MSLGLSSIPLGNMGAAEMTHSNRDMEVSSVNCFPLRPTGSHANIGEKIRRSSKLSIPFGLRGIPSNVTKLPPLNDSDKLKIPKYNSCDTPSDQSQVGVARLQDKLSQTDKFGRLFTQFIQSCYSTELHVAIESTIASITKASNVIFWQDVPSVKQLYSRKLEKSVSYQDGLVGHTYSSRHLVKTDHAQKHSAWTVQSDQQICPNDTPVLLFPLWDFRDNVVAVVEATRPPRDPFFGQDIEEFIEYFTQQFRLYSKWLLPTENPLDLIQDLMVASKLEDFLLDMSEKLINFFKCRFAEIWCFDTKLQMLQCFTTTQKPMELKNSGIVGYCLINECQLNQQNSKWHKAYSPDTDGSQSENILVNVHIDVLSGKKWSLVLRGSQKLPIFTNCDEENSKIILPFLATSIQNCMKINNSTSNTEPRIIQMFEKISKEDNNISILNETLKAITELTKSDRTVLYTNDANNNSYQIIAFEGNMNITNHFVAKDKGIVGRTFNEKKVFNIENASEDKDYDDSLDKKSNYEIKSVLSYPILNNEEDVVAAIQLSNKEDQNQFSQTDIKILSLFSKFISFVVENDQFKTQENNSLQQDDEVSQFISKDEENKFIIPSKLENSKISNIFDLEFYTIDYIGTGLFEIAFKIFNEFGILEKFQISSSLFLKFLLKLRRNYNNPPYHNWTHAIDVLQYVSYEIKLTNSHNHLKSQELLSVLVAALCHDVGHQGFNNAYNINVKTPFGILFKDTSVMETFHCAMAIKILQEDDTNLFYSLNDNDLSNVWSWIIHLILATDMAKHFKLIKEMNDTISSRNLDMESENDRLCCMEMIMKVADISNVSRPFFIADKWCDVLQDEFWRQGDMEKQHELSYSSPLMSREGQNKAKGQIGFYKAVCIPLYSLVARIFPELNKSLDSVNANLKEWERIDAQNSA